MGKSKRPPPPRDFRTDDEAPVQREEEVRKLSSRSMRAVHEPEGARPVSGVGAAAPDAARPQADHPVDPDALAAMLVRLGESERAREVATRRAEALEGWTQELEAKVAAARTRADELETSSKELRSALEMVRLELDRSRSHVEELDGELTAMRRDQEDALSVALEVQRVKQGLEREAGNEVRDVAVAVVRDSQTSADLAGARLVIERAARMLAELEDQELEANDARMRAIERTRRLLSGDVTTTPPPGFELSSRPPVPRSPVPLSTPTPLAMPAVRVPARKPTPQPMQAVGGPPPRMRTPASAAHAALPRPEPVVRPAARTSPELGSTGAFPASLGSQPSISAVQPPSARGASGPPPSVRLPGLRLTPGPMPAAPPLPRKLTPLGQEAPTLEVEAFSASVPPGATGPRGSITAGGAPPPGASAAVNGSRLSAPVGSALPVVPRPSSPGGAGPASVPRPHLSPPPRPTAAAVPPGAISATAPASPDAPPEPRPELVSFEDIDIEE